MTLCALADVQTYIGNTAASAQPVLEALITNVSALIETYCNRTFEQTDYTENRNGGCGQKMYLANGPVTAVTSLTINNQSVQPAPDQVSYGYVFDSNVLYIRRGQGGGAGPQEFYKGFQNVQIVYTAGYATTPPEVNQACVEWVAAKYAKRDRIDKRNETLGQQQTIGYDMSDMPAQVKTALQAYVRWNSL